MLGWLRRKPAQPKVMVIGLDCAEPSLVFDELRDELPTLSGLMERGIWGPLESVVPPITVPAWSCMMSGQDPGQLGIYGFRNRVDYSYDKMAIATSTAVRVPRAWDILSAAGKQVQVVGVPGTFPIRPVNGYMISSFLTPTTDAQFTYPAAFRDDVLRWAGGDYMLDVRNFRTNDKDWLLDQIYLMTDKRFAVAEHMVAELPWDFFMMVEMGTDRIHHGYWRYHAHDHRLYEPGNRYEHAIRDYYRHVDQRIGRLLSLAPDDTIIFVVSDHGAKTMHGGICVNDWLRREGYLSLVDEPNGVTKFEDARIDWARSQAWGEGGYYARIFLNVAGREPHGTVPRERYDTVRRELRAKLEAIVDEDGANIGTRVLFPEEVYENVNGIPPDLIVYFGDLGWRSIGSVGNPTIQVRENDTGPDDANHAPFGMCIYANPANSARGPVEGMHLFDIGTTVLNLLNVPPPRTMRGTVLDARSQSLAGASRFAP